MNTLEPHELPKRPRKIHTWGKHKNTVLMMQNQKGHQFIVEKIDDGIFELTICTYLKKSPNDPNQERIEYVITTNESMLRMLVKQIKECVNF